MADVLSPDGRLAVRWYTWGSTYTPYEHDTRWRVEVLNAKTGLVLLQRQSGPDVSRCAFSADSRSLEIRLSDGSTERVDVSAIELDPKVDESDHYRLTWTSDRVRISGRTYGHLHREIADSGIRRAAFSEHPGLISIVREDGSVDTRAYGRRAWPDELKTLRRSGLLAASFVTARIGTSDVPGETRSSLAVWDVESGAQAALWLGAPARAYEFAGGFKVRVDGRELSLLDHLLPFGAFQLSPDRSRVLRFFTTAGVEEERWSLVELLDANDARSLKRAIVTAPFVRRENETITISDERPRPAEPAVSFPVELVAVRFDGPRVIGRLYDGSEREINLPDSSR